MIRAASTDLMTRPGSAETPSRTARLTDAERAALAEGEATIERGVGAWLETGRALAMINAGRLYRETHRKFESYCWEKFQLERSTAYRNMAAAHCYDAVLPIAKKLGIEFTRESQIRPLCKCHAAELPAVLKLVAKETPADKRGERVPTMAVVARAVWQVQNPDTAQDATPRAIDTKGTIRSVPEWPTDELHALGVAVVTELKRRGAINLQKN